MKKKELRVCYIEIYRVRVLKYIFLYIPFLFFQRNNIKKLDFIFSSFALIKYIFQNQNQNKKKTDFN